MVTNGKCRACHDEETEKDEHHIVPRRFTRKSRDKFERLNILFPEYFPTGENDATSNGLCRKCHQKLDRLIPYNDLMTPDKYYLILDMFLSGQRITKEMIQLWVSESEPEIKKRQSKLFDLQDESDNEISVGQSLSDEPLNLEVS